MDGFDGTAGSTVTQRETSGEGAATDASAGLDGEGRVATALAELADTWLALHRRLLVPGVPETAIDHVLVGPAGVVLVDSVAWDGTVREWQGSLVRHVMTPHGEVERRSLHAEVARTHRIAREMATRLRVAVTPVVCLSGVGAARFGAPRMVRGIWVVPVEELAAWLGSRPSPVAAEELPGLQSIVRAEFASAAGDSSLLSTIGHDLTRQRTRAHRAEAARRAARAKRPVGSDSRAGQRRLRRRRERRRMMLTVAFLWSVFCVSVTGVVTGVLAIAPY
ncbi:nuclease-related domain-containing protein [Oryzobacter telluris]|uniref:nuclease-related domain-containing protein n=1 Tax=Oryzobacter telluris TaxID=3149179 RepID=UPI00370D501D